MKYDLIKSINPDPIIEAIVEFRFSAKVPGSVVHGIVYNALKDKFPKLEELPLSQMPEIIRSRDLNLMFKPLHKLVGDKVEIQIGPQVVAINVVGGNPYMGWNSYSKLVFEVTNKLYDCGVIEKINRIGVRYISFFKDLNIYEKIRLNIDFSEKKCLIKGNTSFVTEIEEDKIISRLSLQNNATLEHNGKPVGTGSIVDIDSYCQDSWTDSKCVIDVIEKCHKVEKVLFFSLLKENFLKTLNPKMK
ncbi:MAG: TIGR04255 family protein [Lentisphaerota bacterium]